MKSLIVEYGHRNKIPPKVMKDRIFHDIDKEKERLQIVDKHFHEIIPFLPLEPPQIEEVINLQFEGLREQGQRLGWWRDLIVDYKLSNYYSYKCVDYSSKQLSDKTNKRSFAVTGARKITFDNQGPLKTLRYNIKDILKSPNRNDFFLIHQVDKTIYNAVNSRKKTLTTTQTSADDQYILMQWCSVDEKSQTQFNRIKELQVAINNARLARMGLGIDNHFNLTYEGTCQSTGDCSDLPGLYTDNIEIFKEIDSILKLLISQYHCQTVYSGPVQC